MARIWPWDLVICIEVREDPQIGGAIVPVSRVRMRNSDLPSIALRCSHLITSARSRGISGRAYCRFMWDVLYAGCAGGTGLSGVRAIEREADGFR